MTRFEAKGDELYVDGRRVIKAWESFSGWYWFATELVRTQDSVIRNKVFRDDTIWFGLVQGFEEEWGDWSEAELSRLVKQGRAWEIPKKDLPYSCRGR